MTIEPDGEACEYQGRKDEEELKGAIAPAETVPVFEKLVVVSKLDPALHLRLARKGREMVVNEDHGFKQT